MNTGQQLINYTIQNYSRVTFVKNEPVIWYPIQKILLCFSTNCLHPVSDNWFCWNLVKYKIFIQTIEDLLWVFIFNKFFTGLVPANFCKTLIFTLKIELHYLGKNLFEMRIPNKNIYLFFHVYRSATDWHNFFINDFLFLASKCFIYH